MQQALIDRYEALILDMDGVLYLRYEPLPGAREVIAHLKEATKPYVLMTNNSSTPPSRYVQKLRGIGMEIEEDRMVTSSQAMSMYIANEYEPKGKSVYLIGEEALANELQVVGLRVLGHGDDSLPEFVVVGWDHLFSYEKLKRAVIAIRKGARFLATNADTTYPTPEGLWPGAGAILASVVAGSEKEPEVVGKPNTMMVGMALERMQKDPEKVLLVGDRLDTDILVGNRAGVDTLLVLTGISQEEDFEQMDIKPTYVSQGIGDLLRNDDEACWRVG